MADCKHRSQTYLGVEWVGVFPECESPDLSGVGGVF
jgi:hypothetical protein